MWSLGPFLFAQPWLLLGLALLPLLWWLLRVTPPAARLVRFPPVRLLLGLRQDEETPERAPPWLLALRLALAALIILGLAHPVLGPGDRLRGGGPIVLVLDDGWAAARNWPARHNALLDLMAEAGREGRPVALVLTAPSESGEAVKGPMTADQLRRVVPDLAPKPWPTERTRVPAALAAAGIGPPAAFWWLSDGQDPESARALALELQRLGPVVIIEDTAERRSHLLLPPTIEGTDLALKALRAGAGASESIRIRAAGEDGRALASAEITFAAGESAGMGRMALPSELRNALVRLEIEGEAGAGAVVLLDERWRRRPVGLVAVGTVSRDLPLLDELYYLERALEPFSEVEIGTVDTLAKGEVSVLVLPDAGALPEADLRALSEWMERGGVLVRFAGPRLSQGGDDLFPVPLRLGGRAFGGAFSWTEPMTLAPFPSASPFEGLRPPDDVVVHRQVLAEPGPDLQSRAWARLADGTPLVTAEGRGAGWLVLFHTTANPDWSNLSLSGLFVEMLRRLTLLSQGTTEQYAQRRLDPVETLDGFGRAQAPPPTAQPIPAGEISTVAVGPRHPPGFYGTPSARHAFNLSTSVRSLEPLSGLPTGVERRTYGESQALDLMPWLLAAALLLALADLIASLTLRGLVRWRAQAATAVLAASLGAAAYMPHASAQGLEVDGADSFAIAATRETHLAYVRTGVREQDEISRAGLIGLGLVLTDRTSVEIGEPIEVDIETNELAFFPLIYWRVGAGQATPSPEALSRLNAYARNGGLLVFDAVDREPPDETGDGGAGRSARRLERILRRLSIAPLAPVPADHVLTRSFYLIHEFPGRWPSGTVWVEASGNPDVEEVSSVVIGGSDWAGAWAVDGRGRPLLPTVPGGERQREMSLRFGVNLVMYALTGNYKADQVHLPAILERLGK